MYPIFYLRWLLLSGEIYQLLQLRFYLLVEFFIGKLTVKDYDSRVLILGNLTLGLLYLTLVLSLSLSFGQNFMVNTYLAF